MKESEAKMKWCPFATHAEAEGTLYSTRGESNGFTACIVGACIAWERTTAEGDDGRIWKRRPPPEVYTCDLVQEHHGDCRRLRPLAGAE